MISGMIVVRIVAVVMGALVVMRTLMSAIRTVVVPRADFVWLTRVHFVVWRRIFNRFAKPSRPYLERDRVMALYAPVGLVTLPGTWVVCIVAGFAGVLWGLGVHPVLEAFVMSGSSISTLGFDRPDSRWLALITIAEAGIGLGIVGLMISYLPTIYGSFSRREMLVGLLEVRAGLPPIPAQLFARYHRIGRLEQLGDDLFAPWEQWFADIEESHTSQPALLFFRSPHPERSWITAAGTVLDCAALHASVIDTRRDPRADLTLRTGFLALRRIADYFAIPYDPDPAPDGPISITRREFDLALVELRAAGVPLKDDVDRAWRDFTGWRVNYDVVLVQLAALVMAPRGHWSSDRTGVEPFRPSIALPSLMRMRERRRGA